MAIFLEIGHSRANLCPFEILFFKSKEIEESASKVKSFKVFLSIINSEIITITTFMS